MKTIRKNILIEATQQKVWDVLLQKQYNSVWYQVFSEGTQADTDWKVGSKAIFTDHSQSGILGKIIVNEPKEKLVIEYEGMIINGKEDYTSNDAMQVKGSQESYILSDQHGAILLEVTCDMADEYFDMMSAQWDIALTKIKELSESK